MTHELLDTLAETLTQESDALKNGDMDAARRAAEEKQQLVASLHALDDTEKKAIAPQLHALQDIMQTNMILLTRVMQTSEQILTRVAQLADPPKRANAYGGNGVQTRSKGPQARGLSINTDA